MNWRLRAAILRALAAAPGGSHAYRWLQRHFGHHLRPEYLADKLRQHTELARRVLAHGGRIEGARLVEVGTGWVPLAPVGWWLCGAAATVTFDLHRHFLPDVFARALHWMTSQPDRIASLYDGLVDEARLRNRLAHLARLTDRPWDALTAAGIDYRAPADAGATALPDASTDLHFSLTVLEHIPPPALTEILREARRLLRPGGLAVHLVDPSDHFSHADPSIPSVHFLRFRDEQWRRLAGHHLAYHNRLREPAFHQLFTRAGLALAEASFAVDEHAVEALRNGFPLAEPFRGMPPDVLCRCFLIYVASPADGDGGRTSTP